MRISDAATRAQEARAKETIASLRGEIASLQRLADGGGGLSSAEEAALQELMRQKEELVKERDLQARTRARVARSWRLPLAAWRVRSPTVDCTEGLAEGRFAAVPTPPHRAEYLDLRQPRALPEGRGRVVPLAAADGEVGTDGVIRALGRTFRFEQDGGGNLSVEIANEDPSSAGPSNSSPPGPNPGRLRP